MVAAGRTQPHLSLPLVPSQSSEQSPWHQKCQHFSNSGLDKHAQATAAGPKATAATGICFPHKNFIPLNTKQRFATVDPLRGLNALIPAPPPPPCVFPILP